MKKGLSLYGAAGGLFMGWKLQRNPGWETGWEEQMKKPLIVIGSFNNYKRSDTADNGSRTRLSSLGSWRSTDEPYLQKRKSGAYGIRTHDLLNAIQTRSQLR